MPEDENEPRLTFAPYEQFQQFYDVFEEIGNGQFAVVKRCVHKHTGAEYAAKFIRKRKVANSRRGAKRCDIEREITVLRDVSGHPNVVSLYEVYESQLDVIIILELITGGELFHYVYTKESLCEQETIIFVRQILTGLHHLHSRHIAHLDLKPENVMLHSKHSSQIKLIDFGLSRRILPGAKIKDMIGTPEFVAPEVVSYDCLSVSTDMWAVGVITYILLSGLSPFVGETRDLTFCNITAVNYSFDEEQFVGVGELAKDFIRRVLVRDPKRRATCEQLLRHPWLEAMSPQRSLGSFERVEPNVHRLKSFTIRRRWKLTFRVVSICNYLMRKAKANAIRRLSKEFNNRKKSKTVLLECSPNGSNVVCSTTPTTTPILDVVKPSPSSKYHHPFRMLPSCNRPKSWLAAPTAVLVVGSSVLGCLCLAFYSRTSDSYLCA